MTVPLAQSGSFTSGATGARFRFVSEPADGSACGTVVLAHAFAEEMNKGRRMCARMARDLAADGWRVVQSDLYGCGDSAGEFRDASWSTWVEDLRSDLAAADARRPVWLWCMRGGALLAAEALSNHLDVNLLLWQPVVSGAQHLQQFLRLHAGARIVGSTKAATAQSPAQTLRAGGMVELGGYELGPLLASGMESAGVDLPEGYRGRVVVFELSADTTPELSPLVRRLAERLQQRGIAVETEALAGPLFWQTQEIEECEGLLQRSLERLRTSRGGAAHG